MILVDSSIWIDHLRHSDLALAAFIASQALFGRGIGYIDAHLLASVRLTADAKLWTRDKRLHEVALVLKMTTQ